MKFVYVGSTPTTLACGRPAAPGDRLDLTKAQAESESHLVDLGLLRPESAPRRQASQPAAPEQSESGEEGAA